jgi:hypothetical protein
MKCLKCGKPLQQVFVGIAHEFKNPTVIKGEESDQILVCTNSQCDDGKYNNGLGTPEPLPF